MALTFRDTKGSPLSVAEGDANVRTLASGPIRQAWVDTAGVDATGQVGSQALRFATVNAALDALGAAGGVVNIGYGEFASPTPSKIRSNTWFRGSGQPLPDTFLEVPAFTQLSWSGPPTKLVNGTVLKGSFAPVGKEHLHLSDLGVDVGSAWCAANQPGGAEGLLLAQGGLSQAGSRPGAGIIVENVAVLCKDSTTQVHAILLENAYNPVVRNVSAYYGYHGFVSKSIGGHISGLYVHGQGFSGAIIKANDYANNVLTTIADVVCYTIQGTGSGIYLSTVDANGSSTTALYGLTLRSVKTLGTKFGIRTQGTLFDQLHIDDVMVLNPTEEGITMSGLSYSTLKNLVVRGGSGNGINISANAYVMATDLKALVNQGVGMQLTSAAGGRLDVEGITSALNNNGAIVYGTNVHTHGRIIADSTPAGTPIDETGGGGGGGAGSYPVDGSNLTWTGLNFNTDAGLQKSGADYLGLNGSSFGANKGMETKRLAPNAVGSIKLTFTTGATMRAALMFSKSINQQNIFTTDYGILIVDDGSGGFAVSIYQTGGNPLGAPAIITNFQARLTRDSNMFISVQISPDGLNWKPVAQFATAYAGELFVQADVLVNQRLSVPQGEGLS